MRRRWRGQGVPLRFEASRWKEQTYNESSVHGRAEEYTLFLKHLQQEFIRENSRLLNGEITNVILLLSGKHD